LLSCGQLAKHFLDAEELIDFGFAREEGVSIDDFAHDATNGPNVDFFAIVVAQEKLWCSVPPSGHIVSQPVAWFVVQYASKPEVTNLQLVVFSVKITH